MKTRKISLGTAGALALGFALIAAPALAQISYPSTPRERAETAELNRNGVIVTSPSPGDEAAYEAAQSDYQARVDAYNAQQRAQAEDFNTRQGAYEAERNAYSAQRDTYENQQDEYRNDLRDYDDVSAIEPFDNDAIDPEDAGRLERLDVFANNGAEIRNAPVEDRSGRVVGHFRRLMTSNYGLPDAVIMLNDRRMVRVPADNLRYDPERDTVLADLTYGEMERMRRG